MHTGDSTVERRGGCASVTARAFRKCRVCPVLNTCRIGDGLRWQSTALLVLASRSMVSFPERRSVIGGNVYWYLGASWILLVLLAVLGTNNDVFTRSVTLLVAVIVVLPLLLFALFTEGRQPQAPAPARASGTRRSHRLTRFRS